MTDETGSTGGEAIADAGGELTLQQAVQLQVQERNKPLDEKPVESAKEATAESELSVEDNAGSPERETTSGDEVDEPETPAIDPPKSWTKDLHERWKGLDPELQKTIVERDRQDQAAIKRAFNDADVERKAIKAEREAVEQARQQYEVKIKSASEILEREQLRDFPDIKTMADVERMALEDPFRKIQWDVHQQKMQAVAWESQQAEGRKAQEHSTQWTQHVQKENALAAELIPDLADKTKGPALMTRAAERLAELGFKPEELNDLASGKSKLSIYDHRLQQLIFSDLKLADIQKAPKAIAAKPVPPVQRPGTSRPQGSGESATIQALEAKFNRTGSLKDAQALHAAQFARRA